VDFQTALFDAVSHDLLDAFKEECLRRMGRILDKYGQKYGFSEIRVTLIMDWELQYFNSKGDRLEVENDKNLVEWLDQNFVVLEAYRHKNPDLDTLWVQSDQRDDFFELFSTPQNDNPLPEELEKLTSATNTIRKKVEQTSNNYIITQGDYKGLVGKAIKDSGENLNLKIYGRKGKLLHYEFTVKKEHTKPINPVNF
jgi:hypothetical protein